MREIYQLILECFLYERKICLKLTMQQMYGISFLLKSNGKCIFLLKCLSV